MNSKELWSKRFNDRLKEIFRYSKYMLNDHMRVMILFVIGAGGFYYKKWLDQLPNDFPVIGILVVIFAFLLTSGNIITLLKEPDKVYLLPLETKMKPYFIRSTLLSLFWHGFILFVVSLVIAPLYLKLLGDGIEFVYFLLVVFILKSINLFIRWYIDFEWEQTSKIYDFFIRLFMNGVTVFFFLTDSFPYFICSIVIFLIYLGYFSQRAKNKGIPWENVIENEEKRMNAFYRLANLSTDVQTLKNTVKRRKWLDLFLKKIPYEKEQAFTFLLVRTFFRSGDYFQLFLRLTIIGMMLIFGFHDLIVTIIFAVFFIYLTGFQLLSLWKHHEAILWMSLYPITLPIKLSSFLKLLSVVLWTQNILFTSVLIFFQEWFNGFFMFSLSGLFIYGFVYLFSQRIIKKWETSN